VAAVSLIGRFLQLTPLSLGSWLIFGVFALLAVPMIGYFTRGLDWFLDKYHAVRGRIEKKRGLCPDETQSERKI